MTRTGYHEHIGQYLLDIADMGSFYEFAVLKQDGEEVAMERGQTIEGLVPLYNEWKNNLKKEASKQKPLTGKYLKLRNDLRLAIDFAEELTRGMKDVGASNFDAPTLYLPRWTGRKIEQAARESGSVANRGKYAGEWVFSPCTNAQGDRRAAKAKAIAEYMKDSGYDASMNYVLD